MLLLHAACSTVGEFFAVGGAPPPAVLPGIASDERERHAWVLLFRSGLEGSWQVMPGLGTAQDRYVTLCSLRMLA